MPEDIEDLVLDLVGTLQTFPAARVLRSRIDRKTRLRADLFDLGSKVGSSNFDIKSAIPLVKLVVNNAPDLEIWRRVFDLIALTSPKQLTMPTAFEKAIFETPLRSSSASRGGLSRRATNGWAEPSTQISFFEWFMKFQDTVLSRLDRGFYTSANKVLRGLEADRKLDISSLPLTLPYFGNHAREVSGSKPERRSVPGFTICGCDWVWVGLNTFIKRDGNGKYIVTRDVRNCLEDKPIATTNLIVCRGTTCYRGKRPGSTGWEYVVKFAWSSDKRQREGELSKLAKERGVTGITVWCNHEQISVDGDPDMISHFRRNMKFGTPRKLSSKVSWVDGSTESSRAYSKTSLRGRSRSSAVHSIGLGVVSSSTTTSSSGQKRKREGRLDEGSRLKRSKSDGSHISGANVRIKEGELDVIAAHSIQETMVDSSADCRNEWQPNNVDSIREAGADSLTDCESETSLLEDGKILHREIYENNIIFTELPAEEASKGRLIDLDLAKKLDSMPSGARHQAGAMQFIAIEVPAGNGNTYRHDLEQKPNKLTRPKTNMLRGWYAGICTEIARNKVVDKGKTQFENIIAEFAPKFENLIPLARELRSILFPVRDGDIFTGTFHDHDITYDGVIMAFNTVIGTPEKEEQVNV
ncbi:hypothetical protein BJ878DRAFT_579890 [Calycina marina]|uniref:Fungal-type protein kinase domain-containing protein n=1 Tax=Calycina marina TaxID=1763456 RepID=A0A9P8CIV3_9HELO|nr:hypothetical protein BJ878DRAFT_579890 [Calycina marina]